MKSILRSEMIRRSALGAIFHVFIAGAVWFLFSELNEHPFWWDILLAVAALNGTYRLFSINQANKVKTNSKYFYLNGGLLLINAAIWGFLASHSVVTFGLFSLESMTLIFINSGLISGAIHTLAPAPKIQKTYLILMAGQLGVTVLWQANSKYEYTLGVMFVLQLISHWIVGTIQSKELPTRIATEENLTVEKEKIQQVVDSVPGFVFTLNEKNIVSEKSSDLSYRLNYCFQKSPTGELFATPGTGLILALEDFRDSKITSATQEVDLSYEGLSSWHLISMTKNPLIPDEIVVVGIPIQDLKNTQNLLKLQTAKAEYSSRLATLGEMAAGIAHEVNNPLAVIMGSATQIERLLDQTPIPKFDIQTKAQKIVSTCQRIGKIVQGLRNFSREGDQDPFLPIQIGQLIEETLELCRERFYRFGVALTIETPPQVEIPARAVQLSQVFLNLLNNAFDATQNSERKEVKIQFTQSNGSCSVLITDSGHGIPEHVAKKIFDPFFTTKEIGKGTGLGLSISKGIIADHQGELILHRLAEGTTFEVRLPLTRNEALPSKSAA